MKKSIQFIIYLTTLAWSISVSGQTQSSSPDSLVCFPIENIKAANSLHAYSLQQEELVKVLKWRVKEFQRREVLYKRAQDVSDDIIENYSEINRNNEQIQAIQKEQIKSHAAENRKLKRRGTLAWLTAGVVAILGVVF